MNKLKSVELFVTLEELIRRGRTGTPDDLAERLSVDRSTVYRMIEELKSYGTEIKFCRTRNSFYYNDGPIINIVFRIEILSEMTNEEMRDTSGGYKIFSFFSPPSHFCDGGVVSLQS